MKSKYHRIFLEAAERLDNLTESKDNIYHYALNVSESFKPHSIRKLCEIIHKISQLSKEEVVIKACRDLYISLITVVGVERVQEISIISE